MIRLPEYPSHLVFDHDPDESDLARRVGPAVTTPRVDVVEDDVSIRVEHRPLSSKLLVVVTVVLMGAGFALPLVNDRIDASVPWIWCGAVFVMFVPLYYIFGRLRKAAAKLGPGAIVDKQSGDLQLPWIDRTIPRADIDRFVDLHGRLIFRQRPHPSVAMNFISAVIYRDEHDNFVYVPFAKPTKPTGQHSAAKRLADHYDVPLQRVKNVELRD